VARYVATLGCCMIQPATLVKLFFNSVSKKARMPLPKT